MKRITGSFANLTGVITSLAFVTSIASQTGTGTTFAMSVSPTFTTSITTPLIIGGTAVGSNIIYKSTTGIGTTAGIAHQWTGGTNGATVIATMLNNGNMGIGTTAPVVPLQVEKAGTGLVNIGKFVGNAGIIDIRSDTTNNRMMFGIVHNSVPTSGRGIFYSAIDGETYGRFGFDGLGALNWGAGSTDYDTNLYRDSANKLRTSDSLIIDGNVGIGTTGPADILHVLKTQDAATRLLLQNANTSGTSARSFMMIGEDAASRNMGFGYSNTAFNLGAGYEMLGANTAWQYANTDVAGLSLIAAKSTGYIRFATGGWATANERVRITSAGNVGIGTTAPGYKLEVVGTGKLSTGLVTNKIYPASDSTTAIQITKADGTTNVLNVDTTNGSVGIGRVGAGASFKLDVASTSWFDNILLAGLTVRASQGGGNALIISSSGDIWTSSAGELTIGGTGNSSIAGNVGIGTTNPTALLAFGGNSARVFQMERHTTANTAGNKLTITAGGATSGATDKAGGNLILQGGLSTGSAESGVIIQGVVAGASGTTDRTQTTAFQVLGNKIGFYASTAVIKQTGCAVPTDLATTITAVTALRTALNNYGLTTVV